MARQPGVASPRIEGVALPDLTDATGEDVDPHDLHECLRLTGDLSQRDLSGARFVECAFSTVRANETLLRGVSFRECVFSGIDAPSLRAPRSEWRSVVLDGSRIGAAEMYEAIIHGASLRSSKLSFVNLRSATIRDVEFVDCTIEDLDLAGATLERVAFRNCTVGTIRFHSTGQPAMVDVDLRGVRLDAIDGLDSLRGLVLSAEQVAELAPSLAAHLGIRQIG